MHKLKWAVISSANIGRAAIIPVICVLHDRPPRGPASEAQADMRIIEALYRSARGGGRPEKA